jgi:hypothetical protein
MCLSYDDLFLFSLPISLSLLPFPSMTCLLSVFDLSLLHATLGPPKERNQPRKFYIPPLFNVVPNQLNLTVVPNFCYYHLLVRLVLVQLLCIFNRKNLRLYNVNSVNGNSHLFAAITNNIMVVHTTHFCYYVRFVLQLLCTLEENIRHEAS